MNIVETSIVIYKDPMELPKRAFQNYLTETRIINFMKEKHCLDQFLLYAEARAKFGNKRKGLKDRSNILYESIIKI